MKTRFTFNPTAEYSFSVTLSSIGYDIELLWLDVYELWVASIYKNGQAVTEGRIVINEQDLFGNVPDIGVLQFEGEIPTRNNIGKTCFLYYYE